MLGAFRDHVRIARMEFDVAIGGRGMTDDATTSPPLPETTRLVLDGSVRRVDDGRVLTPDAVLGETRRGRHIVIPGDTAPTETVRVLAEGADLE